MTNTTEARRAGLDYLEAVTALLDRIRTTDPRAGLFEAAELHWWWSQFARTTDELDQVFWFDGDGRPEAAVIITDWGDETQLDPLVLPGATPDWIAHVMDRGIATAREAGFDAVQLEVDREDEVLREVLAARGFAVEGNGLIESWMPAGATPPISDLHEGYRLLDRSQTLDRPHHMINERRKHTDSEPRLRQTSLYRPDLDLAIYDRDGGVAAYGLFWHNPVTGVGVVEPMRTEDDHQGRGLARHLLTSGLDRLARAGATPLKICSSQDNPAAQHLYLSAGFEPDRQNDLFAGPTTAR